jgi:hypothetical protein
MLMPAGGWICIRGKGASSLWRACRCSLHAKYKGLISFFHFYSEVLSAKYKGVCVISLLAHNQDSGHGLGEIGKSLKLPANQVCRLYRVCSREHDITVPDNGRGPK